MKKLLTISLFLLLLIFSFNFTGINDDDARSQFPDRTFTEADFDLVPNDSCAVLNPERHDDFTHENGYRASGTGSDSTRFVQKMRAPSFPWTYTKICVGWTRTSSTTTVNYDIVVYDTLGAGGAPGSLLALIPGQTIAGVPQFPAMIWNSTVTNVQVTGAVYIGVRFNCVTQLSVFVSMDESVATPLWPGYRGLGGPPTWVTTQSAFGGYRATCIRAEGQAAGGGNTYYSSNWCPAPNYPNLPAATFYECSAWVGDTLYVQTPSATGTPQNTIQRYTLGGSWTTGVSVPVTRAGSTLTSAGGKMYLIGGSSTSVTAGSTDIYEYNPATGTWTLKAPMPASLSGHSAHNWGDSVIFVVCGPWSGGTGVYAYRIASNTWITSTAFTGSSRRSHAGGISGNKIFIAAGFPFTKTFYIGTIGANASTIAWAPGPDVPTPVSFTGLSRVGGVALEGAFYVVCGERGGPGGYSDSVRVWSVNTNAWVAIISGKPGGGVSNMWAAPTAKKINDTVKVFVPGGYNGTGISNFNVIGCGPSIPVGIVSTNTEIPELYKLSQNYPNPFNPVTNIKFSLPKSGNVKMVVFDILGKEVTTLVNEFKTAGNYVVDFNAVNLASGVYFYTIKVNEFTETKKMLLIK